MPSDHPQRQILADEVHARPSEALAAPARASVLALLLDADERRLERAAIERLCRVMAVETPAPDVRQFSVQLGPVRLRWERHGEFSTYTLIAAGAPTPAFAETAPMLLPQGWMASLPGQTMLAAHAVVLPAGAGDLPSADARADAPDSALAALLDDAFAGHGVIGSEVGDGAALAFTDFRLHADGCARFVLVDRDMSANECGRLLQRLFEIETYRMFALLALPIAVRQSGRLGAIEKSLAELTDAIAHGTAHEEALLHEVTRLAAEVESGIAASQFRFGASRAYGDLVHTRIAELRERRLAGLQTIEEFMVRRFDPAVATCANVSQRMRDIAERIAHASGLLATRVGIAREQQNQHLLASMDRRSQLQLRLQQTVEGLSVAAITYYGAGLSSYVAKALKAAGLRVDEALVVGFAIPFIALAALLAIHRVRRGLVEHGAGAAAKEDAAAPTQ